MKIAILSTGCYIAVRERWFLPTLVLITYRSEDVKEWRLISLRRIKDFTSYKFETPMEAEKAIQKFLEHENMHIVGYVSRVEK